MFHGSTIPMHVVQHLKHMGAAMLAMACKPDSCIAQVRSIVPSCGREEGARTEDDTKAVDVRLC